MVHSRREWFANLLEAQTVIEAWRIEYNLATLLSASDGDVDEAASYLGLTVRQVRAALDYYADFRDEVDADTAAAQRVEEAERDRWERQQRALA